VVGAVCGWLVAHFHQDQQTAAVLLFACSILVVDLLLFGSFIVSIRSSVTYVLVGPIAAEVAASVFGSVLGGGLLRR
jgi:hypothetical protein